MKNIKIYYVFVLQNILRDKWERVFTHFKVSRQPRILENTRIDSKGNRIIKSRSIETHSTTVMSSLAGSSISRLASEQIAPSVKLGTSGVYVTTKDSYTLTDGPTIFISNDIEKIAKFCIQQANIPAIVMKDITDKIEYNNQINERVENIEKELEFEETRMESNSSGSTDNSKEAKKLQGKKIRKIHQKHLIKCLIELQIKILLK